MKKIVKNTTVVALSGVMAIGMLSGCGSKSIDGEKTVATVDGTDIPMGVVSLYARESQAQTVAMYKSFMGSAGNIWSQVVDEDAGTTYGEQAVGQFLEQVELMYIMKEKAADYGVEVTSDDETAIADAAAQFMQDNDEDTLKELAVSEDQGYLSNLKLRFIKQNTPEGTKIAFADTVQETRALGELVIQCVMMLLLFLLCFLLVSIFLARWALKPVEKAWEQQNQFIADASHELKTPLTVILANLRILLSHKDATIRDELQWVESTQEEAGRMKKLVENLLFLARSDAKSTPMLYSTFSFSDLILGCLLTFEPVAFEQGVMIEDEISDDIFISGDAPQIRQLVAILLDNACKYAGIADVLEKSGSSDKKVTVTLTSENEKIKLTVHNTGKAIPEEDLPHLFERFYRTDKSRARTDGGYGLGLAIAQTIAKNHRGKITVVSAKNLGTSFTVTFPVSKEKESA